MATHQIHLGVKGCLVLVFFSALSGWYFSRADTTLPNQRFYRYSLGTMRIENPVVVKFNDDENDMYVCSFATSSLLTDSLWRAREDVYPFILSDDGLFFDNTEKPNFFTHRSHRRKIADMVYFSCYKVADYFFDKDNSYIATTKLDSIADVTLLRRVCEYQFYYNIEKYDAYMQADGYWYNASQDLSADDVVSAFAYTNKYKIVVTPHYSFWQLLRLKITYLVRTISRYDCQVI